MFQKKGGGFFGVLEPFFNIKRGLNKLNKIKGGHAPY
ncbi:hypothetical protein HPCU_06350 [Helicobacter pylori Cuz20]|uniref:Uncharacterized protein n=1 Tax=Helicobacter pylori (strain Cuz20) TaxID=765964 RepID=A0AB32X950_HELPC|nr:hypothetical protein HPCU_06350 [Helicobacter pylori Cuz20]